MADTKGIEGIDRWKLPTAEENSGVRKTQSDVSAPEKEKHNNKNRPLQLANGLRRRIPEPGGGFRAASAPVGTAVGARSDLRERSSPKRRIPPLRNYKDLPGILETPQWGYTT